MIVDYEPEHLLKIRYQALQSGFGGQTREHAEAVAGGWSQSTCIWNGQVVACAGILEIWPGRGMAWAALDYEAKPALREITRACRAALDRCPFKRLEMYIRPGFTEPQRWASMLGFELESRMKFGAPDGSDLLVFVRFKRGRAVRDLLCNSRFSRSGH